MEQGGKGRGDVETGEKEGTAYACVSREKGSHRRK